MLVLENELDGIAARMLAHALICPRNQKASDIDLTLVD